MVLDFSGKVVLVTGASRGIGRAVAKAFGDAGAHVALFSRDEGRLGELKDIIDKGPGSASVFAGDVSSKGDLERLFAFVKERFGRLDVLVNNAGVSPHFKPFVHTKERDWEWMLDVNLRGVLYCCKMAYEFLLEGNDPSVVNISSIVGIVGMANIAVYTATKGAITTFTKSLAVEWARDGIRVNAVCPGFIRTDMTSRVEANPEVAGFLRARIPMGRFGHPEEVANTVLFLASPMASYITGHCLVVDGGWLSW